MITHSLDQHLTMGLDKCIIICPDFGQTIMQNLDTIFVAFLEVVGQVGTQKNLNRHLDNNLCLLAYLRSKV
jgi:hypothetical protein